MCFDVDGYDNLIPDKPFSADVIQSFDGRSHLEKWEPIKVSRMEPEKGLKLGDAPGFLIPVFSRRALNILNPLIADAIDVLDLICDEGEFYGINVTRVINAIDYSKSEYVTFSDGIRIMAFQKYVFRTDMDLNTHHIFKIVDEPTRWSFVSDQFKTLVENYDLLGFRFKKVWTNEET